MWLAGIVPQEIGGVSSRKMLLKVVSIKVIAVVEAEVVVEEDGVDVDAKHHMCIKTATCVKLKKKPIK